MPRRVSSLYSPLNIPWLYDLFQGFALGGQHFPRFVEEFIRPFPGCRVLDIGCGTALILKYLPKADYHGFDANPAYIEAARRRHAENPRARLHCGLVKEATGLPGTFDIVIAHSVLHHLDDTEAGALFRLAHEALLPQGRLVTLDGAITAGQSFWERFFASRDRGRYVRTPEAYLALARPVFADCRGTDSFRVSRIPMTFWVMEGLK